MSDEPLETQGIENARLALGLVLSVGLDLVQRTIDHVGATEGMDLAVMEREIDCGGYVWHLRARYKRDHPFVNVEGHPHASERNSGLVVSVEDMAKLMQGASASFDVQVPIGWVKMAHAESRRAGFEAPAGSRRIEVSLD